MEPYTHCTKASGHWQREDFKRQQLTAELVQQYQETTASPHEEELLLRPIIAPPATQYFQEQKAK